MLSFLYKFCIFCCLLKLNQATNTTVTSFVSNTLPPTAKIEGSNQLTYYVTGGNRNREVLKLVKYMVSIRTRHPQKYFGDNHYCAGTIISKKAVLTAAHCVMDKRRIITRSRRLLLVAGTLNRLVVSPTTVQFPVKSVTANSNFIRNNKYDIAIIHLKHEIPEDNENIKIMELPDSKPVSDETCTVVGWGRIIVKGPLAALPLHISVRLQPPEECKSVLQEHYYEDILCAGGGNETDVDPCRGDSGGPLICRDKLTGIISWTLGCGSKQFPSLYTDVFYHRKWIEDNIDGASRLEMNINPFTISFIIIVLLYIFF